MKIKIIAIALTTVMVITFASCTKKQDDTSSVSSAEVSSVVTEALVYEEAVDTPDTTAAGDIFETLDSPDFSQREEVISPYKFPYEPDDLKEDLIDYGSSLGLRFNGKLTMQTATSVVKCETRSAVNDKVLETWCKNEIDDIATLAKSSSIPLNEVEFNITVIKSSKYDGEYDITVYGASK